jgi:hypothetical protein
LLWGEADRTSPVVHGIIQCIPFNLIWFLFLFDPGNALKKIHPAQTDLCLISYHVRTF